MTLPLAERPVIAWFRQDLRLEDNPALAAAVATGAPLLCLFVHAPDEEGDWAPGAASNWWLHHALASLASALREHGLSLLIRRGDAAGELCRLVEETAASAVYWNRRFEPAVVRRDAQVRDALHARGVAVEVGNAALLWEPEQVRNRAGEPFRVFTPFWKHVRTLGVGAPLTLDVSRLRPGPDCAGLTVEALGLLPSIPWDAGFAAAWEPSLDGARRRLVAFSHQTIDGYAQNRDLPAIDGTSRLSPHLHWGQLGPRQVWQAIVASGATDSGDGFRFLGEIAWREFAHHLLHHFPHTPEQALNPAYRHFPWQADAGLLRRWQQGETGFPIVDAGMRQLWRTGWMHNRVRMIAGSVLVKHLLQPWQAGARWFWDTLVDADLASNTMGWQWVAGCGADAAPYFRIFNPVLQGQRFDPRGDYVRRWVPELAGLPDADIHQPWAADPAVLRRAGLQLDKDYPRPAVGLKEGRQRALDALHAMRIDADGEVT